MILINEIYAAHQGEGPFIGTPSIFVRTHLCPVKCNWCDTPFTWDGSEKGEKISPSDLIESLQTNHSGIKHMVWTGGEPLVQRALPYVMRTLTGLGYTHEIETSAALIPKNFDEWISVKAHFNLSPKLMSARPKLEPDATILRRFYTLTESVFKIVVADELDLHEAVRLVEVVGSVDPMDVYLMPCGITRQEIVDGLKWLMPQALELGFKVTTRMHVTAFGDKRGT